MVIGETQSPENKQYISRHIRGKSIFERWQLAKTLQQNWSCTWSARVSSCTPPEFLSL